jgi:ABC-type phosphate transport system substrate-binding protein
MLLGLALLAPVALADNGVGCDRPAEAMAGKDLVVRGSTTLRPISSRAMSLFNMYNPDIKVWQDALGSSAGIRQWIEGHCLTHGIEAGDVFPVTTPECVAEIGPTTTCDMKGDGILGGDPTLYAGRGDAMIPTDICQASRPIKLKEVCVAQAVGMCVQELAVAIDGLGIVVHPDNPVLRLNADPDIQFIYQNDVSGFTWDSLGLTTGFAEAIMPVSRTSEGGTFGAFADLYGIDEGLLESQPSTTYVGSNDEIIAFVSQNRGAIGYVGISFINPDVRSVPVAPTAGDPAVAASFPVVQSGEFAFTRNLYTYTNGSPPAGDPRAAWIEYIMGRAGQANVLEAGYVPAVASNPLRSAAQYLLEDHFGYISRQDLMNIDERLGRIAAARAYQNANGAGGPAATDEIESQFAIEEYFLNDNAIVRSLLGRVDDRVADGECETPGSLTRAWEYYAAAQDAVSGCSPIFPVDCELDAYIAWMQNLEKAFQKGAQAEKSCSGFDPRHPFNGKNRLFGR